MMPGDRAFKRDWATMCEESLGLVPSRSESQDFRCLKRTKATFTINIDDLPDSLLFEILLRLPAKSAARYKSVSRRWFALISHPSFLSRFLCLQRDRRKPLPMEPTLIFSDEKRLFSTCKLGVFETGSLSFDFLPFYQSAHNNKVASDSPVVIASCNDLVLWCASTMLQRHYYICNPYTKQWTAHPPPPQCHFEVRVGFTCEPYYYYKEDVDHQSEKDSTSTCSSTIQLNVDYKYAIVRILQPILSFINTSKLNVEIFTSQTGKWTESVISCPPNLIFDALESKYPGLAYKGKLYWVHESRHYCMIGLDPFSNNNYFHVVDLPDEEWGRVSVSQEGRLRLCRGLLFGDEDIEPLRKGLHILELKDDDGDDKVDGRVGRWCKINTLPLDEMVSENPSITQWSRSSDPAMEIAFDPNNDDILYLRSFDDVIIMCNIHANTLKEVGNINGALTSVFRFMVPWWPTPVPKFEYNHEDTHVDHFNRCILCSKQNQHQILTELKHRLKYTHR